jgi:Zn-dependent peptidase ImmA (M78 family)
LDTVRARADEFRALHLSSQEYAWMEAHANEFAGRMLVPRELLARHVDAAWQQTRHEFAARGMDDNRAREYGKEFMANAVAKAFGVSTDVLLRRLDREKLWPPLD